jgi:prepilin signal peptidase PulO-like enzyme (type II secretory pathway)
MDAWITGLVGGLLGLAAGSFFNVCSLRWPLGGSVLTPRSRCPVCEVPLPLKDLIPVASWIWLRGRCRSCASRISIQYPLVELGSAILWGGSFALWGVSVHAIQTVTFLSILGAIALSDGRFYRIPNPLSLGGGALGVLLQGLPGGMGPGSALQGAVGAMLVLHGVRWLGQLALRREAMGLGDVRMMALLGAFLGFEGAMGAVFLASALGLAVYAPRGLALGDRSRKIPFGVFLALAGALLWATDLRLFSWSAGPFLLS